MDGRCVGALDTRVEREVPVGETLKWVLNPTKQTTHGGIKCATHAQASVIMRCAGPGNMQQEQSVGQVRVQPAPRWHGRRWCHAHDCSQMMGVFQAVCGVLGRWFLSAETFNLRASRSHCPDPGTPQNTTGRPGLTVDSSDISDLTMFLML